MNHYTFRLIIIMNDRTHKSDTFYRAKDPELLRKLGKRETSKNVIEIIPFNNSEFEFTTFVTFAALIEKNYFSSSMIRKDDKTSHIKVFQKKFLFCNPQMYNYSFHITFGINFMLIKVYVKYHMNDFNYIEKNGELCIVLGDPTFYGITADQIDHFHLRNDIRENSLIYQVAKYFVSGWHQCPECVLVYFRKCLPKAQANSQISKTTVLDILKNCPGNIKIFYQMTKDHKEEVRYMSIVFPWSLEVLEKSHYIELDASFYAMKPYKYCITQAIYFNESLPITISIAPSEEIALYQNVIDHLNQYSNYSINWNDKIVLSDIGNSIESVCKRNHITQFLCHRHILEHFGSSCVLSFFVNRLLKCNSYVEFVQISGEVNNELEEYINEKKKMKIKDDKFDLKVEDLQEMLKGEKGDPKSHFFINKWAKWIRRQYHVSTCSNHIEAMHGVINRSLGLNFSFKSKLKNLIETIKNQFENYKVRHGKSIRRKIKANISLILNKLKTPSYDIMDFCVEECSCEEEFYNCMLYGSAIKCQHQLLLPAKHAILSMIEMIKEHVKEDEININHLIISILSQKRIVNQIQNNIVPNVVTLFFPYSNQYDWMSDSILTDFVIAIQNCFKYTIPDMMQIQDTSPTNKIDVYHFTDYVNIIPSNIDDFIHISFTGFDKAEEEIWVKKSLSETEKLTKKIMFETLYEILYVYPDLRRSTAAYAICFDQYLKYLSFTDKSEILKWIPKFKVACSKNADEIMKKHKFFK